MWKIKLLLTKDVKVSEVYPEGDFQSRSIATQQLNIEKKENYWVKKTEPDKVTGTTYEIKE